MQKKILVIDDDQDILEIVTLLLGEEGYEVISRNSTAPPEEIETLAPDLILLDDWMPGGSGSEMCIELKAYQATASIPVVLFTAQLDLAGKASSCGADFWLAKPFDIEHLSKIVREMLSS